MLHIDICSCFIIPYAVLDMLHLVCGIWYAAYQFWYNILYGPYNISNYTIKIEPTSDYELSGEVKKWILIPKWAQVVLVRKRKFFSRTFDRRILTFTSLLLLIKKMKVSLKSRSSSRGQLVLWNLTFRKSKFWFHGSFEIFIFTKNIRYFKKCISILEIYSKTILIYVTTKVQ